MDGPCGKRLAPFMDEIVPVMERAGELVLTKDQKQKLLSISASTIDRKLAPDRRRLQVAGRGRGGTKPGSLLKHQAAIRTFSDWDEARPGLVELDLVAHDGGNARGDFAQTLDLTDRCIEGRKDLKNQDPYDHSCTFKETRYYGFTGDFKGQMSYLGRRLLLSGWRSSGRSVESIMSKYYDRYYGRPHPRDPERTYLAESLPNVSYKKDGDFLLNLLFSERGSTNRQLLNGLQTLDGEPTMGVNEEKIGFSRVFRGS